MVGTAIIPGSRMRKLRPEMRQLVGIPTAESAITHYTLLLSFWRLRENGFRETLVVCGMLGKHS